jgi:hypothetical protein
MTMRRDWALQQGIKKRTEGTGLRTEYLTSNPSQLSGEGSKNRIDREVVDRVMPCPFAENIRVIWICSN